MGQRCALGSRWRRIVFGKLQSYESYNTSQSVFKGITLFFFSFQATQGCMFDKMASDTNDACAITHVQKSKMQCRHYRDNPFQLIWIVLNSHFNHTFHWRFGL